MNTTAQITTGQPHNAPLNTALGVQQQLQRQQGAVAAVQGGASMSYRPVAQQAVAQHAAGGVITTDTIQKYLEDNHSLIRAILDATRLGNMQECQRYQQILQQNLMYLAAIADSQPQPSRMVNPQASRPPPSIGTSSIQQQQHLPTTSTVPALPPAGMSDIAGPSRSFHAPSPNMSPAPSSHPSPQPSMYQNVPNQAVLDNVPPGMVPVAATGKPVHKQVVLHQTAVSSGPQLSATPSPSPTPQASPLNGQNNAGMEGVQTMPNV